MGWAFLWLRRVAWGLLLFAALSTPGYAQERFEQLKAKFDQESDPVRKAKLMSKLGPAEFEAARREANAGQADAALRFVKQYRDEVRATHNSLVATGINAEKHPNGFKQLQISVRESIRELNDMALNLPVEQRQAFLDIRGDLEEINKQLLHALFPRRARAEESPH